MSSVCLVAISKQQVIRARIFGSLLLSLIFRQLGLRGGGGRRGGWGELPGMLLCGGSTSCLAGTEDVDRVEEGELPGLLPLHRTVAALSPV